MKPRSIVLVLTAVCAAVVAQVATASQLLTRNATGVRLAVNAQGQALIRYHVGGAVQQVLASGAVNARPPSQSTPQVKFNIRYGGKTTFGAFPNACQAYDGPPLAWVVAACKAPDGSYWALQSWQRGLPDYGLNAKGTQGTWELHLSHWTGDLAVLDVHLGWAYQRYDELFGTYTYNGVPVHGFKSTSSGATLDPYGRNLYLDTFNSPLGAGWKRENSFLAHNPTGTFCYGLYPHAGRSGKGTKYRLTVIGPGVTPDVMWTGNAPGPYDATAAAAANDQLRALNDPNCRPH